MQKMPTEKSQISALRLIIFFRYSQKGKLVVEVGIFYEINSTFFNRLDASWTRPYFKI